MKTIPFADFLVLIENIGRFLVTQGDGFNGAHEFHIYRDECLIVIGDKYNLEFSHKDNDVIASEDGKHFAVKDIHGDEYKICILVEFELP